ncbi:MAG: ATP-binding protein [Bacteroidales bacterium]
MQQSIQFKLGNGYVLAVEDSLVQAKRLEHFFKGNCINYKIFPNAEEAYQEAVRSVPRLIISDIIMPGMDGYDFCRTLKSSATLAGIPVILLTSLQDPDDIIRGLQAGADNFITKPYDETNLLTRMHHLLENKIEGEQVSTGEDLEINFRGNSYSVKSSKRQILELLLSVYETAVQRNEELIAIKSKLEKSNEDLLQANRDLDSFSRTVSHDLKSPLSVIIGFISVILDNPDSKIDEEERSYLKLIHESSLEMSQLIKDLLVFSQSGKVEILQEDVNLSVIVNELVESLRLRYTGVNYNVSVEQDLLAKADQKMIRVVLDNLLGNAFKYSSRQENPEICFGRMDYYGNDLYFVRDNGVGFDMSKAENLFQPFTRYHSGMEYSGTGVGLSTVKRIIDKHGGQVWAESEVGKGSTFYFTLK